MMIIKLKIKNKAFSLAEVLITLAVIGVVAAISIPSLNNNIKEQEFKTAYKKAFSIANQAWKQAVANNEITARPAWGDDATRVSNFEVFKKYFSVAIDCNDGDNSKCWDNTGEKYWIYLPQTSAPSFVDNSGIAWSINSGLGNSHGAELLVDTNGHKKPNKYGYDRFILYPLPVGANLDNSSGFAGLPVIIYNTQDCLSDTDCHAATTTWNGYTYELKCPSAATHPCLYKTWLLE